MSEDKEVTEQRAKIREAAEKRELKQQKEDEQRAEQARKEAAENRQGYMDAKIRSAVSARITRGVNLADAVKAVTKEQNGNDIVCKYKGEPLITFHGDENDPDAIWPELH